MPLLCQLTNNCIVCLQCPAYNNNNSQFFEITQHQTRILIPKELFPTSSVVDSDNSRVKINQVFRKTSSCSSSSASASASANNRRQIKLPLQKHHSFNFKSSQTVEATVRNNVKRKSAHTTAIRSSSRSLKDYSSDDNNMTSVPTAVIISSKPFKHESNTSAFKPITPVPIMSTLASANTNNISTSNIINSNNNNNSIITNNYKHNPPVPPHANSLIVSHTPSQHHNTKSNSSSSASFLDDECKSNKFVIS